MLTWINFLHIYQPPTQTTEVLEKVTRESYELLLSLLETYPNLKLTLNISGSLVELLEKNNRTDVLAKFKKFVDTNQVELVSSAMYHPILPLITEEEIKRQIKLNTEILKKYFGDSYKPTGFYFPEMAYSKKVADLVKDLGFTWTILDEIHFPKNHTPNTRPDGSVRYSIKNNGMNVVFRDRLFSHTFPPEFILENKDKISGNYLIIAHDGELYGHWHRDDKGYYKKAFTDPNIRMLTVSDYLDELKTKEEIEPRETHWEALEEELEKDNSYSLWSDSENPIHEKMWKFAEFVTTLVTENKSDKNYQYAQNHLDRGLASCAWWWATGRKLVSTSPICWNPTEVEKGTQELLEAIRSLEKVELKTRLEGEAMANDLRSLIWKKHWQLQENPL